DKAMLTFENEPGTSLAGAVRQGALQLEAGHISGKEQAAFDVAERDMAAAGQDVGAACHEGAGSLRHAGHIDLLDEAVDNDQPEGAAIDKFLWRHDNAGEHVSGFNVYLFDRPCQSVDLLESETFADMAGYHRRSLRRA